MDMRRGKFVFIILILLVVLIICFQYVQGNHVSNKFSVQDNYFDSIAKYNISVIEPKFEFFYRDTISVNCQELFDRLGEDIRRLLDAGSKGIIVVIDSGRYGYDNKHVEISNIKSNTNIKLFGRGCTFFGKGQQTNRRDPRFAYSDSGRMVSGWSEVIQSTDRISKVAEDDNVYFLRRDTSINVSVGDFINISQWYTSSIFKISDVSEDYIYFNVSDYNFEGNKKGLDINADFTYSKLFYPRYRVLPSKSDSYAYESRVCNFIDVKSSKVNSIELEGITFDGSAYSNRGGVLNIASLDAEYVSVTRCRFVNCKNPCISLQNTNNVKIDHCAFNGNFSYCVISDDQCIGTHVVANSFSNNGRGWTNSFNVRLSGERFLISDNRFTDFYYGAIAVGDWWGNAKNGFVTGIVEDNEIYYTPDFFSRYQSNTLMDSGAIYVMTVNDDVHIRNNRIYNIIGMKDNRGIFCDDGSCNTKIYGNVITRISNSYSIDLRYVPKVEENEKYTFGKVNVGNLLIYNFVDGKYRFEGRDTCDGDNKCIKGTNFVLGNQDKVGKSMIKNILDPENDCTLDVKKIDGSMLDVTESSMNFFKNKMRSEKILKWFNH